MGLLTRLLTLPLAPVEAPVRGTLALAQQVPRVAEEEYYDPARIREQLEQVDRMRQDGEMSDDEATLLEEDLVDRLIEGQARQRQKG